MVLPSVHAFSQTMIFGINVKQPPVEQCLGTGISSFAGYKIAVYPNPSRGVFTISSGTQLTDREVVLRVFSLDGNLVYFAKENPRKLMLNKALNLEFLAKGIYLLKISGDSFLVNQRIVILY